MGLQKYRATVSDGFELPNGSKAWYAEWMGGRVVSLIRQCATPFGPRTVYTRSEPDTFFSIPAACHFRGRNIKGYLTCDSDKGWEFHPQRRYLGEYTKG